MAMSPKQNSKKDHAAKSKYIKPKHATSNTVLHEIISTLWPEAMDPLPGKDFGSQSPEIWGCFNRILQVQLAH